MLTIAAPVFQVSGHVKHDGVLSLLVNLSEMLASVVVRWSHRESSRCGLAMLADTTHQSHSR